MNEFERYQQQYKLGDMVKPYDKRFELYVVSEKLEPLSPKCMPLWQQMMELIRLQRQELQNKIAMSADYLQPSAPPPPPGFIDMTTVRPAGPPISPASAPEVAIKHSDWAVHDAIEAIHASRPSNGLPYDYLDLAKLENRRPHKI